MNHLLDQVEVAGQHRVEAGQAGLGDGGERARDGRSGRPAAPRVGRVSSRSTTRVMPLVVSWVWAARSLIRSCRSGLRARRTSTSNSAGVRSCSAYWAASLAFRPPTASIEQPDRRDPRIGQARRRSRWAVWCGHVGHTRIVGTMLTAHIV